MTPQEEFREQSRQLNELKYQYNKQQRDLQLKEQRELQRQRNGHAYCHCRNWMDHWRMNHCPQQTQPLAIMGNLNSFNQREYDQLKPLPSANIHQLPLRQGYGGVYYDPSAINVPCTDPRSSLPPDPWLRTSHSRQAQQTQPPFNLPARESSVANMKSLESFIDNDQCDMVEVRSAEARNRVGRLGILEQDESSAANKGNYQPILRQGYGGVYYDPYAIKVARTDPRSPLPSDPWLRDSHPRQAQQTQPPFDLPARESRIANIKSLDSFIQLDNDQHSSKSVEAWIEAGWQARVKEETERKLS